MLEFGGGEKGIMMTDNMTKTQMIAILMSHEKQSSVAETKETSAIMCGTATLIVLESPCYRVRYSILVSMKQGTTSCRIDNTQNPCIHLSTTLFLSLLNPAYTAMAQIPCGSTANVVGCPILAIKSPDFSKGYQVYIKSFCNASLRNAKQAVIVDGMLSQGQINDRLNNEDYNERQNDDDG